MIAFIAFVTVMLGGANMGFEQGQENPQAESFFSSTSKEFVDVRTYGVDEE